MIMTQLLTYQKIFKTRSLSNYSSSSSQILSPVLGTSGSLLFIGINPVESEEQIINFLATFHVLLMES